MSDFEIEIHDTHPVAPKVCATCGIVFDPAWRAHPDADLRDLERIKYCSEKCARRAENKRNYERHKPAKQKRMREKMKEHYAKHKKQINAQRRAKRNDRD